jgi:predicted hydrocarbon binding protein
MSVARPKTKEGLAEMLGTYSAVGWGRPELTELDFVKRKAKVKFKDCFECEGMKSGKPTSNFVRGHLSGAFSAFFGGYVKVIEKKCISRGDSSCEFEITP